ncbi:alpha/beta fold hydrolase [Acetobacterium bakii]|uniref:alpha/beta fold hydrolase n=1 Tax=Acetobacterium bakii TaxID=52689 RepID=UPI000AC8FA44|nr:alpha/beta hydrolase [Acetobacterium bakii]
MEKTIASPQGIVHYWIDRHSDPRSKCLVFTHGLTADHRIFGRQVPYFKEDYTVITWDVPLHGLSRPYTDFSFNNAARDLNEILIQEGIHEVVLIGQSLGGYVCQQFAVDFPEKAIAFVGVDTTPFGLSYYSRSDRFWLRQVEWMSRCYPHHTLVKAIAKGCTRTPEAYANMITMLAPYSKAELCRLMGIAYSGFLKENKETDFHFPVLLILGEFDNFGKVSQYNQEWVKKTGYPLQIIPAAAHNSNEDNPEFFNARMDEFLDSL